MESKKGVAKGDNIMIFGHDNLEFAVPMLATIYLGAVLNPWELNLRSGIKGIQISLKKL